MRTFVIEAEPRWARCAPRNDQGLLVAGWRAAEGAADLKGTDEINAEVNMRKKKKKRKKKRYFTVRSHQRSIVSAIKTSAQTAERGRTS